MSELNLNEVGKHTAQIKIKSVDKSKDSIWWVEIEGHQKKLKAFPRQAANFAKPVEDGAEAEAEIEVAEEEYPKDSGQMTYPAYLRSFGGANKRAPGGGGGGGGRSGSWTPKTPAEYMAGPVSAIVIRAFELCHSEGKDIDEVKAMGLAGKMLAAYREGLAALVKAIAPAAAVEEKKEAKPADKKAAKSEPAETAEDKIKNSRIEFGKAIFEGDKAKLDAFKAWLKEKGKEYGAVIDAAIARGGIGDEAALRAFVEGGGEEDWS